MLLTHSVFNLLIQAESPDFTVDWFFSTKSHQCDVTTISCLQNRDSKLSAITPTASMLSYDGLKNANIMDNKQGFSTYLEFSTLDLYLNAATKISVISNSKK